MTNSFGFSDLLRTIIYFDDACVTQYPQTDKAIGLDLGVNSLS